MIQIRNDLTVNSQLVSCESYKTCILKYIYVKVINLEFFDFRRRILYVNLKLKNIKDSIKIIYVLFI